MAQQAQTRQMEEKQVAAEQAEAAQEQQEKQRQAAAAQAATATESQAMQKRNYLETMAQDRAKEWVKSHVANAIESGGGLILGLISGSVSSIFSAILAIVRFLRTKLIKSKSTVMGMLLILLIPAQTIYQMLISWIIIILFGSFLLFIVVLVILVFMLFFYVYQQIPDWLPNFFKDTILQTIGLPTELIEIIPE